MLNEIKISFEKMQDIKEGDTVLIKESFFNSFNSHCENVSDIPSHNHGIVIKAEKNHKWKYVGRFGLYSYVTFKLPNDEIMSLFSSNLIKLY